MTILFVTLLQEHVLIESKVVLRISIIFILLLLCVTIIIIILIFVVIIIIVIVVAIQALTLAQLGVEVREAGKYGIHAHASLHFIIVAC